MEFEITVINDQVIEQYKNFIKQRLNKATHLPFKNVMVSGQAPQAKCCHDNAQKFEDENSNFECVRGWLVVDGGDSSSEVLLLAHSVVKDKRDLQIYEITPIQSLDPRPFLESHLTEEAFVEMHGYLAKKNFDIRLTLLK